jgi:hypothetical protein
LFYQSWWSAQSLSGGSFPGLEAAVYHLAQLGVAAVAEGAVLGMFAAAPGHGSGFGQVHFERGKGGPFVGAIAKRLPFGLTTTAPIICARGGGEHKRSVGRNFGFVHKATYSALLNGGNVFPERLLPMNLSFGTPTLVGSGTVTTPAAG